MSKHSFSKKFKYWFDNTLSKGTIAIIAWLAVISGLIVALAATVLSLSGFGGEEQGAHGSVGTVRRGLARASAGRRGLAGTREPVRGRGTLGRRAGRAVRRGGCSGVLARSGGVREGA